MAFFSLFISFSYLEILIFESLINWDQEMSLFSICSLLTLSLDINILYIMAVDYEQTFDVLSRERRALYEQRTTLENELNEVRTKIAHLDEILNHLEPLAGVPWVESIAGMGITDAIREVLSRTKDSMSAQEVRQSLHEGGFDMSGLTQPMASIYKVLARLVDDAGVAEREKDDNGRVSYRWKRDEPTEITDDDIPF